FAVHWAPPGNRSRPVFRARLFQVGHGVNPLRPRTDIIVSNGQPKSGVNEMLETMILALQRLVRGGSVSLLLLTLMAAVRPDASDTVSPARLKRLDQSLHRYVDEGRVAGVVALVLQDGKPVYNAAMGWADKEAGIRMQPDTLFRIASQSKAITSVLALSLMEE